jgi:hypothetical protein
MLTIATLPSTSDLMSFVLTALMLPLSVTVIAKSPRFTANKPVFGCEPPEPPDVFLKNANTPTETRAAMQIKTNSIRLENANLPPAFVSYLLVFFSSIIL